MILLHHPNDSRRSVFQFITDALLTVEETIIWKEKCTKSMSERSGRRRKSAKCVGSMTLVVSRKKMIIQKLTVKSHRTGKKYNIAAES